MIKNLKTTLPKQANKVTFVTIKFVSFCTFEIQIKSNK